MKNRPFAFLSRTFLLIWSSLFWVSGHAQTIATDEWIEGRFPVFHSDSIAHRGIEMIRIEMRQKPSGMPISEQERWLVYLFDSRGRMIEFRKVYPARFGTLDTSIVRWRYDDERLTERLEILGLYQRRVQYTYPASDSTLMTISVKRGTLPWQVIAVEQETTTCSGKQCRRALGGVGAAPYMHTDEERDANGRLVARDVWTGPTRQSSERWIYGGVNKASYVLLQDPQMTRITWINQEEGLWCNADRCRKWSMVFFPDHWPKGWIFLDPASQDVEIWEFAYLYR